MPICQPHWISLREEIIKVGLGSLISEGGEEVAKKTARQLDEEEVTIDNYDPLLSAFFAILHNAASQVSEIGGDPLYIMVDGPEDRINQMHYPMVKSGRTWPRCAVCYLSAIHELTCGGCSLPKLNAFDWMIEKAASEEVKRWEAMK